MMQRITKESEDMPRLEVRAKFAAGCKTCGDSLQTIETAAPDHGKTLPLLVAWCMDCLEIRGFALLPEDSKGAGNAR